MASRPGRIATPANNAAQKARAKKPRSRTVPSADRARMAQAAQDEAEILDKRVRAQMDDYDQRVASVVAWSDAKTREQTQTEIWRSEQARLTALAERGRLVDRSLVEAAAKGAHEEIGALLLDLPRLVACRLPALPGQIRQQVIVAVQAAIKEALSGEPQPR